MGHFFIEQCFFKLKRFIALFLIVVSLVGLLFFPSLAWATASSSAQMGEEAFTPSPSRQKIRGETAEVQPPVSLEVTESSSPSLSPTLPLAPLASSSAFPSSVAAVFEESLPEATEEATNAAEASSSSFLERVFLDPIKGFIKSLVKEEKPSLSKDNFQAKEKIKVDLGNYQLEEIVVSLTSQGEEVSRDQETLDDALVISRPRNFKPGKYHLNIKDQETDKVLLDQDFIWGVLAINTNKSIYLVGEMAKLAMAVLDEEGEMVCDASLKLRIKNTSAAEAFLSTEEGTIIVNSECQLHDFTLNPDYEAEYEVGEAGVYEMELTAETENGRYTVTDSFEVRNEVPFEVERITATRIYPSVDYPVVFKIKVNQDFKGRVVESIPDIFIIQNETEDGQSDRHSEFISESITEPHNGEKQIIWEVDWHQGETHELAYQFKAPNISPQFYLLGPLEFRQTIQKIDHPQEILGEENATEFNQIDPATQTIDDPLLESSPSAAAEEPINVVTTEETVVFQESRQWQLAIDSDTGAKTAGSASSADWTGWTTANLNSSDDSKATYGLLGSATGTLSSFVFNIPTDALIDGILVQIEGRETNVTCNGYFETSLSWDDGTSYTSVVNRSPDTEELATTDTVYSEGGASQTWNHAWTVDEINNHFMVKIVGTNAKDGKNIEIDQVLVTVYYSVPPDPPTNVAATDGIYTDKVVVTWTKSTGATGYKVYEGANLLDTLGDVATYDDTAASAPTITAGTATASDGTSTEHVALSLSGQSANNGASRTYKVIAFNVVGDSGDSNTDTGYRGVGSLTYQWQRSAADSDADYSNIDGATTASYNDTGAPANGDGRYYHCVLNATGASQQTSTANRGYRDVVANNPPNSPTSLAQKKTDDTVLAVGDWTNETSVKFTATATDPDASDNLYLCVEKDLLGTAFSNVEDSCGVGVSYSGTGVTVTVTISGLTDASEYHWQARVKDAASAYSSWVSYETNLETERDFGVDTTDPTGGTVYDGTAGVDKDFNDGSLSSLSANWSGFDASVSGLDHYDYSIGTTAGGIDIKAWTNIGTGTSVTATDLTLTTSSPYYFNVRAVDKAGNTQDPVISSDGQLVAPSLTFSIDPGSVSFANLNAGNSYTDSKTATLTTSTNAYNGYVVRTFVTDYLRSVDNNFTIIDFNGGTYASPGEWLSDDRGFGYHSSDTLVQGANKFNITPCPGGGNPPCYAPFSHTGPGDIVADHTENVSGIPISNEEFTMTYKVKIDPIQEASTYSTVITYGITAQY